MIKYALLNLDRRRSTLYAMNDEVEILVIVMDSSAPKELPQKFTDEVRFSRVIDVTYFLRKVEKKLFPQLERGRIGLLTRIQLSIAMRKVMHRTIGFVQDVGESTHVVIIAPPYIDRERLGAHLAMFCRRSDINVIGRT